jgi:hypothetical protein
VREFTRQKRQWAIKGERHGIGHLEHFFLKSARYSGSSAIVLKRFQHQLSTRLRWFRRYAWYYHQGHAAVYGIPEAIASAVCSFSTVADAVNTAITTIQAGVPVARIELLDELTSRPRL